MQIKKKEKIVGNTNLPPQKNFARIYTAKQPLSFKGINEDTVEISNKLVENQGFIDRLSEKIVKRLRDLSLATSEDMTTEPDLTDIQDDKGKKFDELNNFKFITNLHEGIYSDNDKSLFYRSYNELVNYIEEKSTDLTSTKKLGESLAGKPRLEPAKRLVIAIREIAGQDNPVAQHIENQIVSKYSCRSSFVA